jgi:hypothetical protein
MKKANPVLLPYNLYRIKEIRGEEDVNIPRFFEDIFKFPKEELDFVPQDIKPSFHYRYFAKYLYYDNNGLKIQTVVVEKKYTCLTFLEDYVNYYAKCYTKYDKNCRRIHLFSADFDETTFQNMLYRGNNNDNKGNPHIDYWNSYLGCIVIKPLPKGIIGVTYLKTYDGDKSRNRHYTAINTQTINLYGTSLELNTMPFIEQDSNVGSCASAALWMAFQKTSELFHTQKPSPSEITLLAGTDSDNTGKIFPSRGLDIAQICKAINNNGLHSELRDKNNEEVLKDRSWFQGFVYAYLKAGIPILLGIEIECVGLHLITLNGYRFKFDNDKIAQEDFFYKSQFITKFYTHDDQTGPFSRLKFNKGNDEYFLRTSWWKENVDWSKSREEIVKYFKNEDNCYNCKPDCLIVPLDRKIKVSYEEVVDKVKIIKFLFSNFFFFNMSFKWDVFLIKSNTYKKQIKEQVKEKENLRELLHTSLPQYIWVTQACIHLDNEKHEEELIFDFIFDSVEMPYDGKPFFVNIYSESFRKNLSKFDVQIQKLFHNDIENTIYKLLVENSQIIKPEAKSNQQDKLIDADEIIQPIDVDVGEILQEDKTMNDALQYRTMNDISKLLGKLVTESDQQDKAIGDRKNKANKAIDDISDNLSDTVQKDLEGILNG